MDIGGHAMKLHETKRKQEPLVRFKTSFDSYEQVKKIAKRYGIGINATARMLMLERLEELTQKKG